MLTQKAGKFVLRRGSEHFFVQSGDEEAERRHHCSMQLLGEEKQKATSSAPSGQPMTEHVGMTQIE